MIELRRAISADADAIATVYLDSFRASLRSVRRAHSDEEVRAWIRDFVVPAQECWVAEEDDRVVGMMVLDGDLVDQLYVAPDRLGHRIGRRLLDRAKVGRTSLRLCTFAVNERARRFYARNGFVEIEATDGSANEEREPDILLAWSRD
jgi:ribosomal protein S18 acetylase RimI-like enzyme